MQDPVKKIIERFSLVPHPEGGFFREVYRSPVAIDHPDIDGGTSPCRSASTHIYFLLSGADFSAFHRVRSSDEIWHLYAGGPLELHTLDEDRYEKHVLTNDVDRGEPAHVVPAGRWQAARLATSGSWAFCGCTVAPGFDFADFDMPPAALLIAAHPSHERIIRELTKR